MVLVRGFAMPPGVGDDTARSIGPPADRLASRPWRTGALVFDAKTSARIEGGSAQSGRIAKPPGTSQRIFKDGSDPCRINTSTTGVDSMANIEGGVV
jgi:hypothetical protein